MTIEEKAGQLFQTVGAMYDDEAVISGPMQEMGITEKDIQLAGTVLGTMGAEKIKRIQKKYMEKQEREQTVQHGSSVLSKKKILIYILLYI